MGSISEDIHEGIFRFSVPDLSLSAEERSLFAFPANKEVKEERLRLYDARTDGNLVRGPEGLDVHGFTYINHRSALSDCDQWFTGQNIEEIYLPEVEELVCRITGAKRAVVNNVAFRRKLTEMQDDHGHVLMRGCVLDQEIGKLPRDVPLVYGKEAGGSLEPARIAHIDYSLKGLRDTARYCRRDISAAGQEALDAEDAGREAPRYAAYSVWRPVKPVKRDPLAVCDWRSLDKSELQAYHYRSLSDINANGEYIMEAHSVLPPKKPETQRWYWMPEQTEDEVLILKFADTAAEHDHEISGGCAHLSPTLPDVPEKEEPRCSIECRVLAFW